MAISVVVAVGGVGDPLVDAIAARIPAIKVGAGQPTRAARWARSSPREHRDKVAGYVGDGAEAEGATVVVDGRDRPVAGDGFFLGVTLLDHVTPGDDRATRDEIFGPVLSVVRADTYDEAARAGQRQPVRQRRGHLHPRRRRRPPVPVRRPGRHGRRQRAHPGAGVVLQLRRLEGVAVRRHATCTAPRASHFYTRAKVVTSRWPDPATVAVDLGFPRTADAAVRGCMDFGVVLQTNPPAVEGRRPGPPGRELRASATSGRSTPTSCGRSPSSSTARSWPRPARSSSARWSPTRPPATGR